MDINVEDKLNRFLNRRKDRFPHVTRKQKEEWIISIQRQLNVMASDNDIFYDNMPRTVEERH